MPPKSSKSNKKVDPCILKQFPVDKMKDLLVEKFPKGSVSEEAGAYLGSIMAYLSMEILELSSNAASSRLKNNKEVTVTLHDVMKAISTDEDLKQLVESTRRSEYDNL